MSDLKFADTHNLVAFLSKPIESEGFEQIVDFLNAHIIKYALTVNLIIYTSCIKQFRDTVMVKIVNEEVQLQALVDRMKVIITESTIRRDLQLEDVEGEGSAIPADPQYTTIVTQPSTSQPQMKQKLRKLKRKDIEIPQSSGPIEPIRDETDNVESVPTHSNDPLLGGEDSIKLKELMELCTTLQSRVLAMETTKTTQVLEIDSLKRRVKKLEKKKRSRTHELKRLYSVGLSTKVISSDDEGLGDQEDASKQGKKIADIDADVEEVEVEKVVSIAEVTTNSATTTTVDELTLAQTLIEIRAAKPKVKGVMIQEPSEFTTTTTITTPAASKPSHDKGKEKMTELEKPLKKKDQIMYDQEVDLNLQAQLQAELEGEERLARQKEEEANIAIIESWDNIQVMMDADYQMAQQLQAEEQEQLSSEKRAEDSTKRAGTELEQEVAKKQKIDDAKVDDDQEEARMKELMNIIPDEEEVAINAIPLATKPPCIGSIVGIKSFIRLFGITAALIKGSAAQEERTTSIFSTARKTASSELMLAGTKITTADQKASQAADRVVALTLGSAITIPETGNEFAIKDNENEAVRLMMFPLSLASEAKTWLNELNEGTIEMWDELCTAFISRFFHPALFDRLLGEIRAFSQYENETLTEAWLRMKEMLKNCHGHNLSKGNITKIFYHVLSKITQKVLNATAGGIFLYKTPNQASQLPKDKSGKSYDPPINPNDQQNDSATPINFDSEDKDEESTPQPKSQTPKPVKETPIPKPYNLKIPYPQRLRKEKMEAQYGKFLDMIRAIRINVPLVDVLAEMPSYGKFLKELVRNKHKLEHILAAFLFKTNFHLNLETLEVSLFLALLENLSHAML
ncbi:reverse transcriptase domain-containing protein [Tanacetum coccineum]